MLRLKRILAVALLSCLTLLSSTNRASTPKPREGESRFAKLDGQRVHYENHGRGRQALVFVHGWACNLGFWSRQLPAFEGKTRVILIDLPGHGLSDKPQVDYTMGLFARAVDAVLQDAGVDRAILLGHSMGTPVIREFYRKYPQKTLALVIVDGPLRPFGKREDAEKFLTPLRGANYKEEAAKFIDSMFGPDATPALRSEIKNSMLSTPQYVAISAMEGMIDPVIWTEDKITVPTLAVMTKYWPPDSEQFYRSVAAKLDYRALKSVGHFLMMENPSEFNELVTGFLVQNGLMTK